MNEATDIQGKAILARAWFNILTVKRSFEWNSDKLVIQLLDTLVKCAFICEPGYIFIHHRLICLCLC
jgi:hypothetical protein